MPLGLLIIIIVAAAFGLYILGKAPLDATLLSILRAVIIFIVVILVLVWGLNFLGIDTGNVGKNVSNWMGVRNGAAAV
jgi:hypothetical protein